ncbi:hypothetical protein IJF81_00950, partial [bacterium]|nr:hypothetical protein [bacterium]
MATSATELLIKINDATEYLRNAEGKNTVYLEGLSANDISTYKIIDDKLTITTSDNKTISLSNYRDITTLLTDEDGESEPVATDITANKLVNNYDIITDPQDGNTISGTNFNDEINAINAGKIITTTRRVNRRNVTTTTYQGVVINAGDGNDTVTGSIYDDTIDVAEGDNTINLTSGNDTINLGSGINTFNIDVTKSIGTNTI